MATQSRRRTAIHEAGHCALLIALFGREGCKGATIVPDYEAGSAGFAINAGIGRAAEAPDEQDDDTATLYLVAFEAFCLRRAVAHFAGAEAVRQLLHDPDPDAGADDDKRLAADDINTLTGDAESFELLIALAKRRCALLVEHYRPEIEAIARALEGKRTLSGAAILKVFNSSLVKRRARQRLF